METVGTSLREGFELNPEVYKSMKDNIQRYLDILWEREKKKEFLIWTESDVQSYLYCCLIKDYGGKYSINTNPVLSSISSEKEYRSKTKPFYQPDILITPLRNVKVEEESRSSKREKRMALLKKHDSIVVEIKFVQDTYSSTGRKSVSKLGKLADDYEKNRREGHNHIILVFFEKGEKSYLWENDIKRKLGKYQGFTIFHKPKVHI